MLLSLIVASVVVMGSPGPSTISVTAVGTAFGSRRSLGYLSGLIAGMVAVLLAVATGVVSLLLAVPRLAPPPPRPASTAARGGMVVLIHLVWWLAGAAFARVFHDPLWSRRVNVAFAAALVATTAYAVM